MCKRTVRSQAEPCNSCIRKLKVIFAAHNDVIDGGLAKVILIGRKHERDQAVRSLVKKHFKPQEKLAVKLESLKKKIKAMKDRDRDANNLKTFMASKGLAPK